MNYPDPVDEYDYDSWNRKFQKTFAIFKNKEGNLVTRYIQTINQTNPISFSVWNCEKDQTAVTQLKPIYYRVKTGFYIGSYNTRGVFPFLLKRLPIKSFQIGVGNAYKFYNTDGTSLSITPEALKVNFALPIKIDITEALNTSGPISDLIYINNDDTIFYLNNHVGFRKKNKLVVESWIIQEVQDALKGHPISISTE